MGFIKKYRIQILVLAALTLIYLVSRFYSILSLPIFTDEAIYVRWAQIAKQDANWRFISLTDGKQPMFIWLMMISLRFIEDPLLAGRVVSVGAGFLSLIGMYFLGRELFRSNKIGLISSSLYVFFPMSLVYDRMALYDSLVGAFAIWGLFFIVLLVRTVRLDVALILGMVIGGGVLTKTNAFFNIYLLPFSLILFDWRGKGIKNRLMRWLGLTVVVLIITYALYSVLRLSPFFHIITEKNAIFVYPLKDWLNHPFAFFIGNWKAFWDWTIRYLTWPLLALALLSFFVSKSFFREKLILFFWFILPIVALGLFGRTLYPRFIFFMLLPLLPLIAFSLVNISKRLKKTYLLIIFLVLSFALPLKTDFLILTDFAKAYIPVSDQRQYLSDWPAGGGVKDAVEFFKKEAEKGKIYVATQGTFGLMPFALEIYLVQNPNITIEGIWPVEDVIPQRVLEKSKQMPTYFVFYQPCMIKTCPFIGEAPTTWKNLELIQQYRKGYGKRFFSLYKVMP
ncbi:MAG: glycosyltransferase family 39 protein [Candidatus Levybacteria bacterium]|nr:glycosyltransferase family 39 protein [Candidatus Levybacteria bacterium]